MFFINCFVVCAHTHTHTHTHTGTKTHHSRFPTPMQRSQQDGWMMPLKWYQIQKQKNQKTGTLILLCHYKITCFRKYLLMNLVVFCITFRQMFFVCTFHQNVLVSLLTMAMIFAVLSCRDDDEDGDWEAPMIRECHMTAMM